MTLYDFGIEVAKIREAINSLEIKGEQNASLVVYAIGRCNYLIQQINDTAKEAAEIQNSSEGGAEDGGEH